MTSKTEDEKRTAGGFVLLSGKDNEYYIKDKDDDYILESVEPDNVAIRIPLLSSTILPEVTKYWIKTQK